MMEDICEERCIHADQVAKARLARTGEDLLRDMADIFSILSDPTRLKIMDALRHGELCVCDIATVLGMSMSAVSHQLRLLRTARLVRGRRDGKVVFYTLDDGHVEQLMDMALEHCREETR
jgi:DNA-binding transcriptional ArsR family regulator